MKALAFMAYCVIQYALYYMISAEFVKNGRKDYVHCGNL